MHPTIISRQEWHAREPRRHHPQGPPREAFLHHTSGEDGRTFNTLTKQSAHMRSVQSYHMDDPDHHWDDIGYSYVVFQYVGVRAPRVDPRVFMGRGAGEIPAAQEDHNERTIAICVVGDGMRESLHPQTIRVIAALIRAHPSVSILRPHSANPAHVNGTTCPGDKFRAALTPIGRAAGVSH